MFYIFYVLIWIISWFPMRVLYVISDLLYLLVYHIARYRRKVVRRNLINSFPDYTIKQIKKTEKKFYHFFCDLLMEIVRQLHISEKEMKQRITFENLDLMFQHAKSGKSVMLMTGHYCNWEWGATFCLYAPSNFPTRPVYQKLRNKHFEDLMLNLRSRFGSLWIEKDKLIRKIVEMKTTGEMGVFGMVSDQSPRVSSIRYRMKFLNQDTPVFLGTEQLSKKYDCPVYYLDIKRVKRGYYHADIIPIALNPTETGEYEITNKFMFMLEKRIREQPEFWLWSHNRWKHSKKVTD